MPGLHKHESPAHRISKRADQFDARELLAVLGKDLREVEERLSTAATAISSPLVENIADVKQDLSRSVSAFLEKAEATKDGAVERVKERADAVHDQITEHPIAAATSALALGYVLGRMAGMRKRHIQDS